MLGAVKKFFHDVFLFHKNGVIFLFSGGVKYLTIYILGIVFFAGVYMQFPSGFYHSTAAQEPDLIKFKSEIISRIENVIKKILIEKKLGLYSVSIDFDKDFIKISNLHVYHSNNNKINGMRFMWKQHTPAEGVVHRFRTKDHKEILLEYLSREDKSKSVMTIAIPALELTNLKLEPVTEIFGNADELIFIPRCKNNEPYPHDAIFSGHVCNENNGSIKLILGHVFINAFSLIQRYQKALDGKGQYAPNNFWRMFYFSTVTMTTLGYGDIVPLTDQVRFIVAIQSIFGIVIIGFFISYQTSSSRRKD